MPKLLGEFLQEQQEPFTLDVYLLERGYCTRTRAQNSARCSRKKRRQAIPKCAEFVGAVLSRILLHNNSKKIRKKEISDIEENDDDFSSASATTRYNTCSESDVEDHELSPVSVLEETESEASSLHQRQYKFQKTKGESSRCKSKHKSEKKCMDSYNQYSINKRALKQTKKLLVDCVREVIEKEGGKQLKRILGAEELWKVVCENVWLWSQESIHESNTIHLLRCDFMASLEDWDSDSCLQKREVSMEIGDAILEDIIDEFVITCL
ncbi:uncharacterized protein LOC131010702 isoform X2 [Salvia miltiorrhiza]|uniref:uncharacterized protein LOC131010702 isoform X2 n=1 Tax=Salvia miltiorrhiza TaxID=226208 RepID=UPI0025AC74F8|nr:uncharacterized protein LOC131010702 isoform X2 [Salvia miltiorrhiza]